MNLAPLLVLLIASAMAVPAFANPLGATVVNGSATISQSGNVLTVTNSNGAIINWNKFSIAAGETTHFSQPSASSSVLNRVMNDPTVIYGTLSSNGHVWLVNPSGIMIGPGGRIDTAGFVASTLHVRDEDFVAGRSLFVDGGSAGPVINQGEIRTPDGGSVYLVGANVTNEGVITTPQGEAILAAGATVSLSDTATPGVRVDITGSEGTSTNLGLITAEAGSIGMAGVIVRNSGLLKASSVTATGGRIFLKSSQDTYVDGFIVATGALGGNVEILGNHVAVTDNASIDTSGANGGGQILVGGSSQGMNPAIQNAGITYFGPDASLKADATTTGNGGRVVVWANDSTRVFGTITAKGGTTSGNGGYVETSSTRSLDVSGLRVDTSTFDGTAGMWRLDPSNIYVTGVNVTEPTGNLMVVAGGNLNISDGTVITDGAGNITIGGRNITVAGSSIGGSLSLARGSLAVATETRKLLQKTAGAISLRGAASVQPVAPTPIAATATAPAPLRASTPTARQVNTGGLVDGAVTVRLSLVDASPISLR